MNTSTVDQLVTDYLDRLWRAALQLPPDRREELVAEIREHIAAARAAGAAANEAAVRTMLDRLGKPEEIVAAARDDAAAYASPATGAAAPILEEVRPSITLEAWAVAMLTVGSLLPIVGWLVGVFLLWSSRRWRWWEKLLGTLIVPGGPGAALVLSGFAPTSEEACSSRSTMSTLGPGGRTVHYATVCTTSGPPQWLGWVLVPVILLAPIAVCVYLFKAARRRADAEPPRLRPVWPSAEPAASGWGGLEIAAVLTLGLGGLLVPVVGPIVGLALAWSSPRWTSDEKSIATAIAVASLLLLPLGFLFLFAA